MNTLLTGIIIIGMSVVFVNVVLFGFLSISLKSIPLGTLLLIQGVSALFIFFMYQITKRKK
jgi:hypothetical protein